MVSRPLLNPTRDVSFARFLPCLLAALVFNPAVHAAETAGWDAVPAILARIQAPQFPVRDFKITDYGAKPDGETDCTAAIRQAIDACHRAGGGRVVIEGGVFRTGAIHLRSGVNLHVAESATLRFDPDPGKYPLVQTRFEGIECMNFSPLIYAFEQENIAITGRGTLDGSASWETWWEMVRRHVHDTNAPMSHRILLDHGDRGTPVRERLFGQGHLLRPNFIQPYRCRNVLIEGVLITNSPMWVIHPALSTNVTVRDVKVISHGPNNDGCDPDSCRDVLIEDCLFDTGDDCIAIKSGKNADGRRVGMPSENIVIRNCEMKDGHGGVVLGSEVSGGVRNVYAEDCRMDSPNLDRALRLKTNSERGGIIENVFFRRIQVGRVAHSVVTIDLVYGRVPAGPFPPIVRNVEVEDVRSKSSPRVLSIVGTAESRIENVRIINATFSGVESADILTHAGSVGYENVTVEPVRAGRN